MNRCFALSNCMKVLVPAVASAAIVISMPIAAEAATIFTNRGLWEDAVNDDFALEDFNGFDSGGSQDALPFPNLNVVSEGLPTTASNVNRIDNDRFEARLNTGNANRYDSITWTFDTSIRGFFARFISIDNGLTLTGEYGANGVAEVIDLFDELGITNTNLNGSRTGGFGLVSDTDFNTITFEFNGTGNAAFAVDNLAASEVPTPALLPALIGMGIAAVRKRQQTNMVEES